MATRNRTQLVAQWWQALRSACHITVARELLGALADEAAAELATGGADAGAGIGAALARAGLEDAAVPVVSAQILSRLASTVDRVEAERIAALAAGIGRGHRTELDRMAGSARHREDRFQIAFDNAPVAIGIGDRAGHLIDVNQRFAEILGVPIAELRLISSVRELTQFLHPDDRGDIDELVFGRLMVERQGAIRLERRMMRRDGSLGWSAFTVTYVPGIERHHDYLLYLGEDVTERHLLEEELHRQARHDALTGLPNRRQLLEKIEAVIDTAGDDDKIGLCFADLDRFKEINDRYGHSFGDRVLAGVALRLSDSLADFVCLPARLGGDEFVALVPPPDVDRKVAEIAERMLSSVAQPIIVDEHRVRVSISIGAMIEPCAKAEAEKLLDAADRGLYRAKLGGRDQWVLHAPDTAPDRPVTRANAANPEFLILDPPT
ncbi:sensor domain-containing diguanylate cyclase [Nocardia sp. alder85J]|uniref:sensor domain-containing diguanylate cyclase n=1 Tax=Nocardia sp. alder85J TaxID=2862949 RepID=UPI001CD6637A|nr:sensor domain-containing diguanylate cyclase [Nocardia sp. alder85J]MCX4098414.1 sensor domain-containing diguanylate cyclase [Nocardia sp. alder85J]